MITQRDRRNPSLHFGAWAHRRKISMMLTVDFPEPTGPIIIRTLASERMNLAPVGGGRYLTT